ncbi:MAG TPA: tetratricopeptide repeat protein [Stellaceae bacterium]|jgi:protein O-GlcNAc transferase|nr:tetratricopeptide repeat protein [Stellaceae bacterium]
MSAVAEPLDGWLDRERQPFATALAHCRSGALQDGYAVCQQLLAQEPNDIDALHLSGLVLCQAGAIEAGIEQLRRAVSLNGQLPVLHYNLAEALRGSEHLGEAAAHYEVALRLAPAFADAQAGLGNCLLRQKRLREAAAALRTAIALDPGNVAAYDHLGSALQAQSELEAAGAAFRQAIALDPGYVEAHYNLGNALLAGERYDEALASFDAALRLQPDLASALHNRGVALLELERCDEALASFDRTLQLTPEDARTFNSRGGALRRLGRSAEAIASYDQALALSPDLVEAIYNRANALLAAGRHAEAIAGYDRALLLQPGLVEALNNRGTALLESDRFEEAAEAFSRLLRLSPDHPYARGTLHYTRLLCCDWVDYTQNVECLGAGLATGQRIAPPFMVLSLPSAPETQRIGAALYGEERHPPAAHPVWRGEIHPHERIRVAYLSADFRAHAATSSIAEVWERHDRTRFETIAVSFGPSPEGAFGDRLRSSFERFFDARDRGDREIAAMLKAWQVDIAVDLMGYTKRCRPGIFALRPAPIQVNYLGYLATMAADYIDYIVADRMTIPEGEQSLYSEKVVFLPDTFLPTDATRQIPAYIPTRAEEGLPETGFVFCSFNNTYKITPPVFDLWLRLLQKVEDSVLWLLDGNDAAVRNRRAYASARGVDPDRLVFARRKEGPEHLARHRLAGLFLDTVPCNAGATAADALWAGLPIVTCAGSSFVGRMAASQLAAIGLPELVTTNLGDYEVLALQLAREPAALATVKAKLERNRATHPLFNTARYTRHLESAYEAMWQRYQRGEPPTGFAVPPLPPRQAAP